MSHAYALVEDWWGVKSATKGCGFRSATPCGRGREVSALLLLRTVENLIFRVLNNMLAQNVLDGRRGAYSVHHQIAVVSDHGDACFDRVTVDN